MHSAGGLLQQARSLGACQAELLREVCDLLETQGHLRPIAMQWWLGSRQELQ